MRMYSKAARSLERPATAQVFGVRAYIYMSYTLRWNETSNSNPTLFYYLSPPPPFPRELYVQVYSKG
jgi:hypothetical protein